MMQYVQPAHEAWTCSAAATATHAVQLSRNLLSLNLCNTWIVEGNLLVFPLNASHRAVPVQSCSGCNNTLPRQANHLHSRSITRPCLLMQHEQPHHITDFHQ